MLSVGDLSTFKIFCPFHNYSKSIFFSHASVNRITHVIRFLPFFSHKNDSYFSLGKVWVGVGGQEHQPIRSLLTLGSQSACHCLDQGGVEGPDDTEAEQFLSEYHLTHCTEITAKFHLEGKMTYSKVQGSVPRKLSLGIVSGNFLWLTRPFVPHKEPRTFLPGFWVVSQQLSVL